MARIFGLWASALLLVPFAVRAEGMGYLPEDQIHYATRQSVGVMGDFGVSRYNRSLAVPTEPGAAYGAHVELTADRQLTLEIAYQGALNDLSSRFSSNGRLMTNQIGAGLRINFVPPQKEWPGRLRPFIYAAGAYQRISTQNFTPGMSDANAFAVPVAAGIEGDINRFLIGARFTYNFLFNENESFSGGDADNWVASINVGARIWP